MIPPATAPAGRAAKLLVVDPARGIRSGTREDLPELFVAGDLVIANDAATIPASLTGTHEPTGRPLEVRLAGRPSLDPEDVHRFTALVFGGGDWHTPTERREAPPTLRPGDRLLLGPLRGTVTQLLDHPRLVALDLEGDPARVWAAIAEHGRPIQYAHLRDPLALWDVWTPVAARPVAFEPPSAGFALRWSTLARMRERGVAFATLTHAAGISSTGDPALDARLPLAEPYHIPVATARAIGRLRAGRGRVIAVGTTVVRALEHAAQGSGSVRAGRGTATGRIGPGSRLGVVDGIVTGTHEPSTSHYQMLRLFADDEVLDEMEWVLEAEGYQGHEFGDSVLLLR